MEHFVFAEVRWQFPDQECPSESARQVRNASTVECCGSYSSYLVIGIVEHLLKIAAAQPQAWMS